MFSHIADLRSLFIPKSWLGFVNRYIFQWFWIRLWIEYDVAVDESGNVLALRNQRSAGGGFMGWICPLTGYGQTSFWPDQHRWSVRFWGKAN